MKNAAQLLSDLDHTPRKNCLSEYASWIADVREYLEQEAHNERGYGEEEYSDPTIATQMKMDFILLNAEELL